MHLATMLELAVDRHPEAETLVDGDQRFRYDEWNRRIDSVSWGLHEMGIRPGDRVALCVRNSEAAATTCFALYKLGAVPVPLNFRWKGEELAHAFNDAAIRGVVHDETTAAEVNGALRALADRGRGVRRIGVGRAEGEGTVPYRALLACRTDGPPDMPRGEADHSAILYTSGTTGRPKGVLRTHRSDHAAVLAMIVAHRWTRSERSIWVMPLHHTMGLHTLLSFVLLNGTLVILPRLDLVQAPRCIAGEGITALYLVPTAFHDLIEHAAAGGVDLPPVRKLASAGAPMPPALVRSCLETFQPEVFINHYGCTEMHVITANGDLGRKPTSAGRPAIHSRIRIVTADRERRVSPDEVLPRGATGEVIVDASSPQAFSGYLNRSDATEDAVRGGWYFTGDAGFIDDEGDLHLLGRVDDMIVSGGENIHPSEVEKVLRRHPLVSEVAVVGLPHERWGEAVTAFIVRASSALNEEEMGAAAVRLRGGDTQDARRKGDAAGTASGKGKVWPAMISQRLSHFEPPPQWSTMREAAKLERDRGSRIVHMEKGDYGSPEFAPPRQALEAAMAALQRQYVRYAPGPGIEPLREALAGEMTRRGRPTSPDEIAVTPGAKFALAASFLLLLDDGDEVIMPDPGYPPDEFWARYLRAPIRYVRFRDARHVDCDHLAALIGPRTRVVVFNTPQRPNGQLIENTDEVAGVLARFPHVTVISDEIFSQLVYEPHAHRSLAQYPSLRERTVVIDTFSKTYVMTGFRIGWVVAPRRLAGKYDILIQNSCTNVPTFTQEAALAALHTPRDFIADLKARLRHKRDLAYEVLSSARSLTAENAQASFYLFPRLAPGADDREMVLRLLEQGGAVVPGSAFGRAGAGHIRLTFALDDEGLLEGMERLVRVVDTVAR